MKIFPDLSALLPTRRGRRDRPMIVANLMFLAGVLAFVLVVVLPGGGEEQWALVTLAAISGLLVVGGCSIYLVTRIVRGVRWLRGEREPEPPPEPATATPAAQPHRVRNFFLWLIGLPVALLVLSMVFTLMVLGIASHRVEKVRASLHPGMTAPQVLEKATGWFMLSARALRPDRRSEGFTITSFHQGRYHLLAFGPEPRPSLTEAELMDRICDMAGGGEWKFVFTYRSMTPARYSFAVRFSPEGKVVEVSAVNTWD